MQFRTYRRLKQHVRRHHPGRNRLFNIWGETPHIRVAIVSAALRNFLAPFLFALEKRPYAHRATPSASGFGAVRSYEI